jgi:hypothetical protein
MDFITLAEAANLTGKTLITIRRLAKKPTSKPYVKLEEGKLYIDKDYVLSRYSPMSTHMHTQPTQIGPELSTQEPTQNKQEKTTQQPDLDTQMLIHALKEQYESRIQDLKEALQSKEKEIERISTLFNQHQQLEMARVSKLPAKINNYPEAEAVEDQPTPPASEPPLSAESIPDPMTQAAPEPPKKKRWWQF